MRFTDVSWRTHTHTHTHIYQYQEMRVCLRVRVCVFSYRSDWSNPGCPESGRDTPVFLPPAAWGCRTAGRWSTAVDGSTGWWCDRCSPFWTNTQVKHTRWLKPSCSGTTGLQRAQKNPCYTSLHIIALATSGSSHQVQDTDACIQNDHRLSTLLLPLTITNLHPLQKSEIC